MPAPVPFVDPFAATLHRLRTEQHLSLRALASKAVYSKSYLHDLETGLKQPTMDIAKRLDAALDAGGVLVDLVRGRATDCVCDDAELVDDDELEAIELGRRVEASDVGARTLERLEAAVDELAVAYPTTPAAVLQRRVRRHLGYVYQLLDARATLAQRRRLLVVGGWLSLLNATLDVDVQRPAAANAWLVTARQMAEQTGHDEIQAWVLETLAWSVLSDGDYLQAAGLAQQAQQIAPRDGSALIQATAQEGRALARLADGRGTRRALARLERLASALPLPDQPEHHYRYDPAKAHAYTATTLAWLGDPAAVDFARAVVAEMLFPTEGPARPRRAAAARLDLALALLRVGELDEAAAAAQDAVTTGLLVGSNYWRVTEVVHGVEVAGIAAAPDLRDAYEAHRPAKVAVLCPPAPRTAADS